MTYPDGTLVKGPKALCELQGYVYDAWLRMAEVFDELGKPERAAELRAKAAALFQKFNEVFWDEESRLLRLYAGRREAQGPDASPPIPGHLPVVRHRAAGPRGTRRRAADGARHVLRLGHPHAVGAASGVQSVLLPERLGVAARQRLIALGFKRYGFAAEAGADRPRHQRRRRAISC